MNHKIYIDGGSRGNPGPSALGAFFEGQNKKYSEYLGKKTNNEAEYLALIFALKKTKSLIGKDNIKKEKIIIYSDSELLVKQMRGEYKIKNPGIQKLFLEAWNLKVEFKNLTFHSIPREKNTIADHLVNQALDAQTKNQTLI